LPDEIVARVEQGVGGGWKAHILGGGYVPLMLNPDGTVTVLRDPSTSPASPQGQDS
jgi:hypothetical protein